MALSDYEIPRTSVPLNNGNAIEVRGMSLTDVSLLYRIHEESVDEIVKMFKGKLVGAATPDEIGEAVTNDSKGIVIEFLRHFPLVASNIIALACDEPDAWRKAQELPMPVQVEALVAISRLTFEDINGFKKFVGNALAVIRSVAKETPPAKSKKATKSTGTTD